MSNYKLVLRVQGEPYHIFSHYSEEEQFVYSDFMVTKETTPFFLYQLGVTKMALQIYNYRKVFNPSEWLFERGVQMVREMIEQGESRPSGIITSWEMSQQQYDWRKLENIDLTKSYTQ